MSRLRYQGSVVGAALAVALLSPRAAEAQQDTGFNGQPRQVGVLGTGLPYDIVNKKKAEQRLEYLQRKLARDTERGNAEAAGRDARKIERDKYRIAVDTWLIRKNFLCDPFVYPVRTDEYGMQAIADVARPLDVPLPVQTGNTPGPPLDLINAQLIPGGPTAGSVATPAVAVPITVTIVNAGAPGLGLTYSIEGVAHQADAGSRQELSVPPDSIITFDAGETFGQRQYTLSPGVYEFRSSPEGWKLFKLPATP